jgi:hypothetical protein
MKVGQFNIEDYLEKLYEESTPMMDGGEGLSNVEGIVIPDTNVKSYNWLKKEFQKARVEVKVEMNMGGAKFEPGYDLQTDLKSVKDFKPGMFGEIKTADTKGSQKSSDSKKPTGNLDTDKTKPGFQSDEGEKKEEKNDSSKSKSNFSDIKDKKHQKHEEGESEEKEKREEHEAGESKKKEGKEEHESGESKEKEEKEEKEEKKDGKPEVKKIDLKTKKK